jgi:hypothetical protein
LHLKHALSVQQEGAPIYVCGYSEITADRIEFRIPRQRRVPIVVMYVRRAVHAAVQFPFLAGFPTAGYTRQLGFPRRPRLWIDGPSLQAGTGLIAGPPSSEATFRGGLPNGRAGKPAGISIQASMNPLDATMTPDGKSLVTSNDNDQVSNSPPSTPRTQVQLGARAYQPRPQRRRADGLSGGQRPQARSQVPLRRLQRRQ